MLVKYSLNTNILNTFLQLYYLIFIPTYKPDPDFIIAYIVLLRHHKLSDSVDIPQLTAIPRASWLSLYGGSYVESILLGFGLMSKIHVTAMTLGLINTKQHGYAVMQMFLDLSMSESMSVYLSAQLCLSSNYPYHHKGYCLRFQCNCTLGFEIRSCTKGVI